MDDGWTMEMAIPFNTVTFDPNNDTWGINFYRRVVRKAERMAWQSRNGAVNPTVSGEMYGLQGLNQGIGLDIIPSASSIYSRDRETDLSDSDLDSSIDINYKITPSINGLITFNTDFAATQVDGRKLDLQRFSLFFPEKRAFFLTDFDIFQFGGIPTGGGSWNRAVGLRSGTNGLAFFSRRIGLTSERAPVDLIGGAKISGRLGDTDFGALYILQDEYATSTGDVVGQSDLMVARVSQGVLEESALGAIMTIGNPGGNTDSSLFGADFQYRNTRLGKNRSAEGRFWIQKSNNEDLEGDDLAWSATVSLPARLGLEGGFQIHEVQQNFDPALGFANRTGVRLYGGELGFRRNLSGNKFIREVSHGLEFTQWNFLDTGDIQTRKIEADFLSLRSQSGDWASFRLSYQTEGLLIGEQPLSGVGINIPDGDHDFLRWNAFVRSASFRPLQLQLSVQGGDYYDGKRLRVEPEISWRANEHLTFELSYGYNKYEFPNGQSAIARLVSFESEFAFNSKMSLVTLAQYDNLSEEIGINSRFRYNLTAGQDIWFVINHNMRRDSSLDDRFDFRSIDSLAVAKVRYTFRY